MAKSCILILLTFLATAQRGAALLAPVPAPAPVPVVPAPVPVVPAPVPSVPVHVPVPAPVVVPVPAPHVVPAPVPVPVHPKKTNHTGYKDQGALPSEVGIALVILGCGIIGLIYAVICAVAVSRIVIVPAATQEGRGLLETERHVNHDGVLMRIHKIAGDISKGAQTFLLAEYKIMAVYMAIMSVTLIILLGLAVEYKVGEVNPNGNHKAKFLDGTFSMISFLVGSTTSIAAGYIGMRIATFTNSRTTVMARKGYDKAFSTAIKGGIVMGFGLTSLGLIALLAAIYFLWVVYYMRLDFSYLGQVAGSNHTFTLPIEGEALTFYRHQSLMQAIAPFGLGGSSIALFGRVGGGIFTKAADVGADLVGKVQQNIPEDDPRNPGVIADNVGDNVGDIAGMGSDLFGSFAEATCASLVVMSSVFVPFTEIPTMEYAPLGSSMAYLLFPLMITAVGIITCLLTTFLATHVMPPKEKDRIEWTLKVQLVVSTVANTIAYVPMCYLSLPHRFALSFIYLIDGGSNTGHSIGIRSWWHIYFCIMAGLWSGLIIGLVTEYYTSHSSAPTRKVAQACKYGAATNVIHGLALGYESAIVPCFCIAFSIWISMFLAGMLGVAMAALGILSTMSIGLTIDAYGPISDNAGGIAEMAGMESAVRERTDALDAAGNTTAAIGKGFAIGSAAFVGVALFGAYQTNVGVPVVNILDPRVFFGIVVGAMLPYWFSAMTMKSVGTAAEAMVAEIQRQFNESPQLMSGEVDPDYTSCITIATNASLVEMLPPGALVILSPLVTGIFLGPEALSGLLPASMASGVMMAISAANTGGAWDNAKKFVEGGNIEGHGKGSEVHKAAVIGDTVGDPLKDTSGPALNILVKLMAILSVVFAPIFQSGAPMAGLLFNRLVCNKIGKHELCPAYSA